MLERKKSGKKRRGRPQRRLVNDMKEDMKIVGVKAADWVRWRHMICFGKRVKKNKQSLHNKCIYVTIFQLPPLNPVEAEERCMPKQS